MQQKNIDHVWGIGCWYLIVCSTCLLCIEVSHSCLVSCSVSIITVAHNNQYLHILPQSTALHGVYVIISFLWWFVSCFVTVWSSMAASTASTNTLEGKEILMEGWLTIHKSRNPTFLTKQKVCLSERRECLFIYNAAIFKLACFVTMTCKEYLLAFTSPEWLPEVGFCKKCLLVVKWWHFSQSGTILMIVDAI